MTWTSTKDPGRFSWSDAEVEVLVDLEPFRLSAVNRATGRGFRTCDAKSVSANRLGGLRPEEAGAPVVYRVGAEVLGSYAGLGPRPRWFGFQVAAMAELAEDRLRLRLWGSKDPIAREGWLTITCGQQGAVQFEVHIEPDVAVAETAAVFDLDEAESFFGFGERFAHWDHRGQTVEGWTEDSPFGDDEDHRWTYWPLPYVVTGSGLGLVVGTAVRTRFRLGPECSDAWSVSADQDRLEASLLACRSPREVVERFTSQHGRPPVPPLWGLGVWKTMLGGDELVEAQARRMEDEHLAFNAVWMYDQLEPGTNSGWGSAMGYPEGLAREGEPFRNGYDGRPYPDMPGLVGRLHAKGYKVLGYLNPQFLAGTPAFEEGDQRGYFLRARSGGTYLLPCPDARPGEGVGTGVGALLDPTNPDAVSWWSEMLRRLLTETGYDGWMHDFGEYTPLDALAFDGRTGAELRNSYPVEYQRPCAEVVAKHKPDAVFFVRSGYLGSTALCPAAWPGDQHTTWGTNRGLRGVIRAGLSLSLAGVNTWGSDIAGMFGTEDPEHNELSKELWVRWCQFGALCPVMRDHLGDKRRPGVPVVDLWHDEETVDTWRRYAQLHLALLPYLYGLAHEAHCTGVASVRPLLLEFPDDATARSIDDEYLLGPALLVAPVLEEGARARRLYFPAGSWHSFFDDQVVTGPTWEEVDAPLSRLPLFVRGGAALPLSQHRWHPGEALEAASLLDEVELRLYPAQGGLEMVPVRLHDGTVIRVGGPTNGLELDIEAAEGPPSTSQWAVRLPGRATYTRVRAQSGGTSAVLDLTRGVTDRWWDTIGSRANIQVDRQRNVQLSFE